MESEIKVMDLSLKQKTAWGPNAIQTLPEMLASFQSGSVLLVTGPALHKKEIDQPVLDILEASGRSFSVFSETEADPSIATTEKIADTCRKQEAALLVAFGGGSVIDAAKAAGLLARQGGSLQEYAAGKAAVKASLPLIAIPTTAGTGSEATSFAVITDPKQKVKMTVASKKLNPSAVILDPAFLGNAPERTAAFCGMDALIHALESWLSKAADPVSLAFSERALHLIGRSLVPYVKNRKDEAAAMEMLMGSYLAGLAFDRARLGNVHALSHPLSAHFHLPHGQANAILLPYVLEYNEEPRYQRLESLIFEGPVFCYAPGSLVSRIRRLNAELGIPSTLKEAGVNPAWFSLMAEDANASGNVRVNPRKTSLSDLVSIYEAAYGELPEGIRSEENGAEIPDAFSQALVPVENFQSF